MIDTINFGVCKREVISVPRRSPSRVMTSQMVDGEVVGIVEGHTVHSSMNDGQIRYCGMNVHIRNRDVLDRTASAIRSINCPALHAIGEICAIGGVPDDAASTTVDGDVAAAIHANGTRG